jgi:hypothetical protein
MWPHAEEAPPKRRRVVPHTARDAYERGEGVSPEEERESFCDATMRGEGGG